MAAKQSLKVPSLESSTIALGSSSFINYEPGFFPRVLAETWFEKLDKEVPWIRPEIYVYGRKSVQPRETCYVADLDAPHYKYSGFEPPVYTWKDFPVLKEILAFVHKALPGEHFNSVLVNRYVNGLSSVAWHADKESVYGLKPTIVSVSLGATREFLVRRKTTQKAQAALLAQRSNADHWCVSSSLQVQPFEAPEVSCLGAAGLHERQQQALEGPPTEPSKQLRPDDLWRDGGEQLKRQKTQRSAVKSNDVTRLSSGIERLSFELGHGTLLVMSGYVQRDWEHAVPKRTQTVGTRINLTFRLVLPAVS